MDTHNRSTNPRLSILRTEVDQNVLKPFQSHGWSAKIIREIDHEDCIEITAKRNDVSTRIAVLYSSSGISHTQYRELSTRVDYIFFSGQPYMLEEFASGATVPVESLDDFFQFLVNLNKRVEPDRSPPILPRKPGTIRRLTAENPLHAVVTRLQQFASNKLAAKLVERRAAAEGATMPREIIARKATGIAYSMRSALDYILSTSNERLNRRVLSLYYGAMAFAQAEMLASPSGPIDLHQVEGMTKQGHGVYTLVMPAGGFADLRVGVLASGFLPQWMNFLGHDTSLYPRKRPRSPGDLDKIPTEMVCSLRDLFASMPEIDDLFYEVFGGPPRWVSVAYDSKGNLTAHRADQAKRVASTYGLFIDRSGLICAQSLATAGWPLAEVQQTRDYEESGNFFRARVDHTGEDLFWSVLPTYFSPFGDSKKLLLPTVGGLRDYRVIAFVTLYALSIVARYNPSLWQRVEGGDEDQYLALFKAALDVWERLLPEQFLESIAGETVRTAQPGSMYS